MKQIGRKPILTPKVIKFACDLIASGEFDNAVAGYVGVSEVTWHKWKSKGQEVKEQIQENEAYSPTKREQLYLEFIESLEKAYAKAEMNAINNIRDASKKDWRAAAWFLERRYNGNWSKIAKATGTTPQHLQNFLEKRGIEQ